MKTKTEYIIQGSQNGIKEFASQSEWKDLDEIWASDDINIARENKIFLEEGIKFYKRLHQKYPSLSVSGQPSGVDRFRIIKRRFVDAVVV